MFLPESHSTVTVKLSC